MTHAMPDYEEDKADRRKAAAAVDGLIAANEASNKTMIDLVESVRKETAARDRKVEALERSHKQTRWVIALTIALIAILLTIGVFNATNLYQTRKAQKDTQKIAAGVAANNRTLLDCVNSTGTCGEINQRNQARILDTVKRYELTVIYCARTNPQPLDPKGDKFLACVDKLYPGGPKLNRMGQ